jgi:tRNA(adenine34) deaminase
MDYLLTDEFFMKEALKEARMAFEKDEVPVGAVMVLNGRIISKAHNLTETLQDTTAHAEIQAITAAASFLGAKYLNDCVLYVTLEPCTMCAGALFWSQIGKIVFGAYDEKRGYTRLKDSVLHPRTQVIPGILETECRDLLIQFFQKKR